MDTNLILVCGGHLALAEEHLARIHAAAPDKRVAVACERAEIENLLDEVEIAVGAFPHDLLLKAPHLRWFQQSGAGADWLLRYPAVAESDLIITNGSGVHAIPITEHILALMLAFARSLHTAMRLQARHEWVRLGRSRVFELSGKTMLLIGVGAIGQETARAASALGMRVLGVRRDPNVSVPHVERMYAPSELLRILPEADVVVLTVPLTQETRGMIGEVELCAMKSSAYIINIGRGGTIQEDALIRALREGQIAGAGLDVFATEPLPSDSPLWDMENVIITSHYAGHTPDYLDRLLDIFLDNLQRYRESRPLRNLVDKKLGY